MTAIADQGTQAATQIAQAATGLLQQLLSGGTGGQAPDGSYASTPYNSPLQSMLKTLGIGSPSTATAPGTGGLASNINSARNAMNGATGHTGSSYHGGSERLAAAVPGIKSADGHLAQGVNDAAAAVGGGRQQMMSAIDGLNTAMSAIQPLMGTVAGQAGASSIISSFIQTGIQILTQVLSTLTQSASQQVAAAQQEVDGLPSTSNVNPTTAVSGPYSNGSGKAPAWFYEAANEALDSKGITDPQARANWIRGMETVVGRESGFRADAINNWDANAAAGNPSGGPYQFVKTTFDAYADPGYGNWGDPTAQSVAFINYAMEKYHVSADGSNLAANIQQADPNRAPKGY
jgi:hypothetical protein